MENEYNKNYVKEVILRIDFPNSPIDIREGPPEELLSTILENFPVLELHEVVEKGFRVGFGKEIKLDVKEEDKVKEYWYYDNKKEKSITISKKYIFFDYNYWKKDSFEELKKIFENILSVLFKISDPKVTRLGLRYINHVTAGTKDNIGKTEWNEYLNPDIISIFKVPDDDFEVARAFQNLELIRSNIRIRFQFGMHNPDYPAPIKKRLFILDYDGYCESLQNQKEFVDNMGSIHTDIWKLFKKSIGSKLEEIMKRGEE